MGRVSVTGTVQVTEQFVIEKYSHVQHIVSNVQGRLRDDRDALDALVAGFPNGTTSGAPKIRALEIIDELEKEKRGIYGGAVGYFSANGNMDTCIALRTGNVHLNGAGADFGAPFGGYKQSGTGREWGEHGFKEFLEVKAVLGYQVA